MNIQDIYELMERFEDSSMTEMNLELEGAKIVLKKGGQFAAVQMAAESGDTVQEKSESVALIGKSAKNMTSKNHQKTKKSEKPSGTVIEAPLVGTFYAAPSPEAESFVKAGQEVKKGDVVGIIEAMKLMNEITAPCDGTIESIEVENGQMVEFHQVLMRIS